MTDNEIIKALECCVSEQYTCEQCPYQEKKHYDFDNGFEIMPNGKQYDDWSCERWLNADLLDLINHQKTENERLNGNLKFVRGTVERQRVDINNLNKAIDNYEACLKSIEKIKVEAYKEFAERLKEKSKQGKGYLGNVYHSVDVAEIDNLLKEMVGDNDE